MHTTPKSLQKDYPVRLDVDDDILDRNTSLWWMREMVGRRKDVLDVGCATGYLARLISANDCTVCGIEINAEAAHEARKYCEKVFEADLDFVKLSDAVEGRSFDVMIFGDVLEHIRQPVQVLEEARALLRADGYVVVSIPNIAHGAIRLALLHGGFNYSELGILDETHLRFFTLQTVEELFLEAGFEVQRIERTKLGLFEESNLIPKVSRGDFPEDVIAQIERDPEFDTLQFVVQATPLSDEARLKMLMRRFAEVNTKLSTAQNRLKRKREELDHLSAVIAEMQAAERRRTELPAHSPDAEHFIAQLAAADRRVHESRETAHRWEVELAREQERSRAEIARLSALETELRERILQRQTSVDQLHAELEGERQERLRLAEAHETWTAELNAKHAELNAKSAELNAKSAELNAKSAELSAVNADLDAARSGLANMQAQLVQARDALHTSQTALEHTRGELHESERMKGAIASDLADLKGRFLMQTDMLLDRTRHETRQISELIGILQTSKFWSLKRFLARLMGR